MNLSYFIGAVLVFAAMVFGIMRTGEIMNFIDFAGIIITICGTLFALFSSFPMKETAKVIQHFPILLGRQKWDPIYYIDIITELSQEARKKGLLALEDRVSEFEDPFLRDSVMLIVDAMEPDKVRDQLDNELGCIEARHASAWSFYDKGAAMAPAFGMCATLIALINMLGDMNFEEEGGATKLAANMSMALVTTFYGSLMANAVFIPIGTQLRVAHEKEMLCKEIIIEGIISIQAGENPRHINEKLMSFMNRRQRDKYSALQDTASE